MDGGLLFGIDGRPPTATGGGALTKAKGSVIGWTAGGIVAVGAVLCLLALVLRNIFDPEGGGPEAPGGPVLGGGCMTAELTGPRTRALL